MKLSEVKEALARVSEIQFVQPDGQLVPNHFHVTEVGLINKHFIDCGGTIRKEAVISFQLFTADDFDHRLSAPKLKSIIDLSEKHLNLPDAEVEVEYQSDTIGKYGLTFNGSQFELTTKQTDCLAKDNCGIPEQKQKVSLSGVKVEANACAPGSGCC